MVKTIWKHIRSHWKKNIWITLELLLIFCLIWYMVDYFFVLTYNKNIPSHRDSQNTYMISLGVFNNDHQEYKEEEGIPENGLENFRRIVRLIKDHPDVESIALSFGYSSLPGLDSSTEIYQSIEDTTLICETLSIWFITEEDYFQVFRHTTDNGKKIVSAEDYDWNDPSNIIITQMTKNKLFPDNSAIGKSIQQANPPHYQFRITGILDDIKRFSYLRPYAAIFIPARLDENNYSNTLISIRTREGISPAQFIPAFKKEMSSKLRIGNHYLSGISSFSHLEKEMHYKTGITNTIRMRTALIIFLFVNILLCVFGTFWHRVSTRTEEIGIRGRMASKTSDIRKLFIIEGLILLTIVIIPAMLIEMQFVFAGLIDTLGQDIKSYGDYLPDHLFLRFIITNIITWIILVLIVIIAVWYPAYSASTITPVDALRDE